MDVYLGADHGGFAAKNLLITHLQAAGYSVHDQGAYTLEEADDYPQYAAAVARAVAADPNARGLLLCRSGEGMAMAANRFRGVRAAVVWQAAVAEESRRDNDANIAVIPADFIGEEDQRQIAERFLSTPFSHEERHARRIHQLETLP